jgi:hypothetical protein
MKDNLRAETDLIGIHESMPSEAYHAGPGLSFYGL